MTKTLSEEQEFLAAFESFKPIVVVEDLRAYYDDDGWVYTFAGSGYPEGANWIAISRELYQTHNWQWLRLVNGKLIEQKPNFLYKFPLIKSDKGVKVVKHHASLVIEPHEEYKDVEYYDRRDN